MNGHQALGYLSRNDKWFLGGGKMVIWAPEFPLWLDKPGYWDHACFLDYRVGPIFTLAILDEKRREIEPTFVERFWQPDHSSHLYRVKSRDLIITERRALLPWDVLVSTFEFANSLKQEQNFDLVLWSAQDSEGSVRGGSISEIESLRTRKEDGSIVWQRGVRDSQIPTNAADPEAGVMMRYNVALGGSIRAESYSVKVSDRQPNYPRFKYSPFYEKLSEYGNLGNEEPSVWIRNPNGLVYLGLHYKISLPPGGKVTFSAYASIAATEETALTGLNLARRSDSLMRDKQPAAAAPVPDPYNLGAAANNLAEPRYAEPIQGRAAERERRPTFPAKKHWSEYFENLPDFTCSDPYLQKYYWYRYYGLKLNTIVAGSDERLGLPYPCVFEGINLGWFRQHITYSAQCHMLEARWMHDPALAQGSLLNFIQNQQPDGAFPGVIKNIYRGNRELTSNVAFYHANWGMGVRELYRVHPDRTFLEKVFQPLSRYAEYFDNERDKEQSGLYDVINHWETGQEFMNRYQQVDPQSDSGGNLRLKGLDATVYIYQLQDTLAWMADELGNPYDAERWRIAAEKTRRSILSMMWDLGQEFFYDVNPSTMHRITAKAAVGFYPFMAGLGGKEHLGAFYKHLFNEKEFWTPFPAPSSSRDDEYFSPDGEWKERRLVCPWNGRTWLMTNSHVAESLCRASQELDPNLQPKAVEFLNKFIRMLFLDGDVERPSSYEYYNPLTGQAPFFRGTEDYMHSWIADLIIKYVAGVQPQDKGRVLIRPLPFNLDYFTLDRIKIADHWLKITWRKEPNMPESPLRKASVSAPVGLAVWVDGVLVEQRPALQLIEVQL
ncbi:MAG: hypothetical protein HXX08_20745 [Chloroflexi bacterium]|uniref:Mannosylglycerate hydrolase MGH1-like glycoside hydrolase domain-containing protein n=1 Tax=Candidatus Chlorohelix allophototropha TaxID=3003348 RepID=A0A8T7M8C3_9CHLR|nr:hypothetical protein [Chloroflexota bacterium]WJW68225.1 hypothetical protein OZ401_003832 [Chloroflexota bacterium L227-S17]